MPRQSVYQQNGDIVDFVNTSDAAVAAGQVVPMVTRIGCAVAEILPGATGGVVVQGVFSDVPADNTVAFAVGDALYWNVTGNKLTKTATDNTPIGGWCVTAKAQSGTVAVIKLIG